MTNIKVTNSTKTKNVTKELARVSAYAHTLAQLCELSPHAEPLSLEQLEVIFKDIAQVCDASLDTIYNLDQ